MATPGTFFPPRVVQPGFDHAATVTPNDGNDLPVGQIGAQITCGILGNIVLDTINGETITLSVARGQLLPIRTKRVRATGTTATPVVAVWRTGETT